MNNMSNEIKEILAYFEEYIKITDMHDSEPMLNWKDLKIVLDYITNLQEENEKLKSKIDEVINKQQFIEEKFDYKSRNEKAIEYLNKHSNNLVECLYTEELEELSNILQGSEKE